MPLLFPKLPPEATPEMKTEGLTESSLTGFVAGKGEAYDYLPEWLRLPPLYHTENHPNPLAIIKLFTPWSNWSWYLMESDGQDLLFCLVVGLETELGYASLEELQSVTGPLGLRIERDLWFQPTPVRDLPAYKERWGEGGPYPGLPSIPHPPPDSPAPPEAGSPELSHPTESCAPPPRELPDGWTTDDIRFLLERLAEGPLLVAESELGISTIHDNFGHETRHLGFGLMQVEGDSYTLRFDAGGAMQRTPSGKGWTRLTIEGPFSGYDSNAVRQILSGWLRIRHG